MSDTISWHLRLHGPQTIAALCARFDLHPTLDQSNCYDEVLAFFETTHEDLSLVVPLPDGRLTHVLTLFNGLVLTERIRTATTKRWDLWATPSLQPLLDLAREAPIALADGGQLELSSGYGRVLLGPPGWLPSAEAGTLLAFRIDNGVVSVDIPGEKVVRDNVELHRLRGILASHLRYADGGEPQLCIDVTSLLAMARLEDPQLLSVPTVPLQELLHEPIDERTADMWRNLMAWRQDENVSFSLEGMPMALYAELNARAYHYGMSFGQFVIAVLGHLAWRTPFAEDMSPYDSWVSDPGRPPPRLQVAGPVDED